MAFPIYTFNKISGKIDKEEMERETDACFIKAPSRWYPKGQRLLKSTYDGTWHKERTGAVRDGLFIARRRIESLKDDLTRWESRLSDLEKEAE